MTINVYWTTIDHSYVEEPSSVWKEIVNTYRGNDFIRCPVLNQSYKNTFSIKTPFDYMLRWDGNKFESDMYNQSFFDKNIIVRDTKWGVFSYLCPSIMLIPDKSVLMETKQAIHGRGDLCKNTSMIEGIFNPHKHIRKIEFAGIFHHTGEININENDDLYYIKFHTNEKINFKRCIISQEIKDFINGPLGNNTTYTKHIKPMSWWYNISKERGTTKKVLNHVKNNLCE